MWIVKLALRRPYTFVVVALCMLIFGAWFIFRTPKDIFPSVDIPVISVIWTYTGLSADEMSQRITTYSEYGLSNNVDDIARIESQTYDGIAVIRLYFYPEVEIEVAIAEATASSQSILRLMPQGIQPPTIVRYSANSVPIVQMAVSSSTLTGEDLYDYAQYRIRQNIAVIQGVTLPTPYGGFVRQMMVDLDLDSMQSKGLSPRDINKAINTQSVILPVGDARIGNFDYPLNMNNTPLTPEDYNDIPVKMIDNVIVYLRDVAFAHDGFIPQVNVVRSNGKQCVLLTILKHGKSSTLDIIDNIKEVLPSIQAAAPKGMDIELLFDQSFFVKAAIKSVVTEGLMAALLTGAMILLFLGSIRSTFIVLVSIPLSILTSIIFLSLIGYTLNIMTLGGLALAIGILVDDATVTLENIHRNIGLGKPLHQAVLDGSSQIAIPAFVSTLCICIVFLPVSLLVGPARFLFIPFAFAVVFAIMTSYFLSRTLVPLMFEFLLEKELTEQKNRRSLLVRFHENFEKKFHRFRKGYIHALHWALYFKGTTCLIFGLIFVSAMFLVPFIGTVYFPSIDANQLRMHVNVPSGTRLEMTQVYFSEIEEEIKRVLDDDFLNILDNIGLPASAYNLAFGGNTNLSTSDGDILISLKSARKHTSQYYQAALRTRLNEKFPDFSFFFEPADMINQILQFGLPSPIDIRVIGYNQQENLKITRELVEKISHVPGAVDVQLHQIVDLPELFLNVDRTALARVGLSQLDLATDYLVSNSSSTIVTPNFWLDRKNGIPYLIAVMTPKYRIDSLEALMRMPVSSPLTNKAELLSNLAKLEQRTVPAIVNHYNIQPVYDIYANVQGRDLGGVASDIQKIIDEYQPKMAPGNQIKLLGMVDDMNSAFLHLGMGFIFAILLVYFVMVVNFQSWLDPFIIITGLVGVFSGIIWILYLTQTHVSVPALMGAIMCIGVGTANSILIVTFGNYQLHDNKSSIEAALIAGATRLRPVLMTALAMIFGMIPMALALGEGGEQNAPLGISVIGGLTVATFTTLFFVPTVFSLLRTKPNKYLAPSEETHG
jgi:multidrug efflux pump subunit AcrB